MFIQIHNPKSTGEIISLERRLYEVVQKEWDNQEPTGHSFAQQTQKDVSSQSVLITNLVREKGKCVHHGGRKKSSTKAIATLAL